VDRGQRQPDHEADDVQERQAPRQGIRRIDHQEPDAAPDHDEARDDD